MVAIKHSNCVLFSKISFFIFKSHEWFYVSFINLLNSGGSRMWLIGGVIFFRGMGVHMYSALQCCSRGLALNHLPIVGVPYGTLCLNISGIPVHYILLNLGSRNIFLNLIFKYVVILQYYYTSV